MKWKEGQPQTRKALSLQGHSIFLGFPEGPGFLLVFCSDKSTVCLYTHIPVTDFPESERVRLMEGIWFSDMMDVYHYLESYTS